MKRVLFYTANGVGLGHLRRTQLIAEELRKKKIEVVLATSSLSPQILGKFFDHLIRLEPFTEKLSDDELAYLKARTKNEKRLLAAVKKFKPDLIVGDFHLSKRNFVFLTLKKVLDSFPIKNVFIWRIDSFKNFPSIIKELESRIKYFNKIIIPHSQIELVELLPFSFLKKISADKRFEISGPIFQKLDKNKLDQCRKKYNISSKDFIITITLGAGGGLKDYCDFPDKIVQGFLNIYSQLARNIPNLRSFLILGPYFKKTPRKSSFGLKVVRFENNLLELMKVSNLVVSTAGYNTCNELIEARTPSILIPLKRGGSEQFDRADFFEKKGVSAAIKNISSRKLLEAIMSSKDNLSGMKNSFKNFSDWGWGNKSATKIILKELNEK